MSLPKGLRWSTGLIKPFLRSPTKGSQTVLDLATSRELNGVSGVGLQELSAGDGDGDRVSREQQEMLWRTQHDVVGLDDLQLPLPRMADSRAIARVSTSDSVEVDIDRQLAHLVYSLIARWEQQVNESADQR